MQKIERIMQQHGEVIGAAGLGTVAWLFLHWLSLLTLLPAWIGQALVTILVSSAAITANHFIKRELNKRWPEGRRRAGDTGE